MKTIDEGSLSRATVQFFDPDWAALTPVSARYRIDCETTCTTVLDWTDLTPASTLMISITPSQNVLINQRNKRETKRITVEVNTGTSTQMVASEQWQVKNERGIR